MAEMSVENS